MNGTMMEDYGEKNHKPPSTIIEWEPVFFKRIQRLDVSCLTGVCFFNDTHFFGGGSKVDATWLLVILRDLPLWCSKFGLVSYNDPS